MPNVLEKIAAYKRQEVKTAKAKTSERQLRALIAKQDSPRGFLDALKADAKARPALIAEIKKASPSKGLIRADFNPSNLAKAYADGGATCLSVLTDIPSFQGNDLYLTMAKSACTLPVLRKDFMLDPYQIYESRALGADCVLLIMAMLKNAEARKLYRTAKSLGIDVLVETHDVDELARAVALGADMIGINNRNLKTFETTLKTFEHLAPRTPTGVFLVAESGIFNPEDILRLTGFGAQAFLVGESLMRQNNVKRATQALLGQTAN